MELIIMRSDGELSKFRSILEKSDIKLVVVDRMPFGIQTLPCLIDVEKKILISGRKKCLAYLEEN